MRKKLNILIQGMGTHIGGVESFIINYFKYIDHTKIHFDFICYDKAPAYYQEIIGQGSRVYIIPGRHKNYFSNYIQTNEIIEKNQYDVIWSNLCSLSDILLLKIAYKRKINKRIVHAHNSSIKHGKIITEILHFINKKRIIKYVTDFWACSQKAGNFFYPNGITKSPRFRIIHNAIDTEKFAFKKSQRLMKRKELNIENKLVIGHIGRFHFQKNHEFLLKIFIEIYKNRKDAVLMLVGDGELFKDIKSKVELSGLNEHVLFLGSRNDIAELLHAMDIFVFPSRYEGLPFVLVEAQTADLSCFFSDTITNEVIINDNVYPISIQESAFSWSNIILKNLNNIKRKNTLHIIKKSGYDITTEAKIIESYFLNNTVDI
jgi:glycosyltransferase involved in cell wall biosynthesis